VDEPAAYIRAEAEFPRRRSATERLPLDQLKADMIGILLLFLLSGCAIAPLPPPAKEQVNDTTAVYAALLEGEFLRKQGGPWILIDSTEHAGEFGRRAALRIPGPSADVIERFSSLRGTHPINVTAIGTHESITVVSRSEIRQLGDGEQFWTTFQTMYPEARGYLAFAEVAFSQSGDEALVYVSWRCGFLCGRYYIDYLRRTDEGWLVIFHEIVGSS